jgi:hypothetical protein
VAVVAIPETVVAIRADRAPNLAGPAEAGPNLAGQVELAGLVAAGPNLAELAGLAGLVAVVPNLAELAGQAAPNRAGLAVSRPGDKDLHPTGRPDGPIHLMALPT